MYIHKLVFTYYMNNIIVTRKKIRKYRLAYNFDNGILKNIVYIFHNY